MEIVLRLAEDKHNSHMLLLNSILQVGLDILGSKASKSLKHKASKVIHNNSSSNLIQFSS